MKLVVDLRRAFDSGLGTYIRQVVPRTLALLEGLPVLGLIGVGDEERHRAYLGTLTLGLAPVAAAPLSVAEQWALRRYTPAGAVFWATTLSHAVFTRRRLVATVHDVAQLALPSPLGGSTAVRLASRVFFQSLRRRAELLLFNSNFTANEFARLVGPAQARQLVTPLGVDAAHWAKVQGVISPARLSALAGAPYFLCVGNIRPHKNLPAVMRAFAGVSASVPHHLVLIGRPHGAFAQANTLALASDCPPQRVHFLGELPQPELRQWMQGAAALVMPSFYEGFGLPVLEAMAAACPVIASSAGALPEAGGDAALYFDPHDVAALMGQLLAVAQMPAAERMDRARRGVARAHAHSWDRTAELTASALRTVLAAPAAH